MAELIDMAQKGQIHCFVSTSDRLPEEFDRQLIRKEKVYLCIPRSNPLNDRLADCQVQPGQTGTAFDYSCLNGQNFIFLEPEQPLQLQTYTFLQTHSIAPKHSITVNQVSTAVNLTIRGEGICFASVFDLLPGVALLPILMITIGTNDTSILVLVIHSVVWPMSRSIIDGFKSTPKPVKPSSEGYGAMWDKFSQALERENNPR